MTNKVSVCILALNEEKHLKSCLTSINNLADEIVITVDSLTSDNTISIAKQFTDKVFIKEHQDNFHKNKQFTLDLAKNDWILWMDADEAIEPNLVSEIKTVLENPQFAAYQIPRKNMMFGKWIAHSGWYPDYQIRLFQKSKTKFPCKHIHEHPQVNGEIGLLQNHILHQNYNSVTHFLEKMNNYTSNDTLYYQKEKIISDKELITHPMNEFCKRFLMLEGYKDGSYGLMVSQLQAVYELVLYIKINESTNFASSKAKLNPQKVDNWIKEAFKIWQWWYWENRINNTNSILKKIMFKLKRKLNLIISSY